MTRDVSRDIRGLLLARSWHVIREAPIGSSAAELWQSQDGKSEMYVPQALTLGSFETQDIVERIGDDSGETRVSVERALEFANADVTRFRMDSVSSSWVPLEAGAALVQAAFGVFRAAATTARRPRQIIGTYSKAGDEVARGARLAHTEQGSFVFPILMPLTEQVYEPVSQLPGLDVESVSPESIERRVVRTVAQSLTAFDRHVLQPAREPRERDLTPVVLAGGSKEMFAQIGRALAEPDVAWIETAFEWAASERTAPQTPGQVVIPGEARRMVSQTVKLLSSPRKDALRIVTGPIISIGHRPGEPLGEIGIQAPSLNSARVGRVEAQVEASQLSQIHEWMNLGTTVVVEGVIMRQPGRIPYVQGIVHPRALSDSFVGDWRDDLP